MVADCSVVVSLVRLVDRIPQPPPPPPRRGRPPVYSDRLFLKAVVIIVLKRLGSTHALLAVLDQPTPEMRQLRALLAEGGRFPTRRTFERRLAALPAALPAQIACLGRHLMAVLDPWRRDGRAVAVDSTTLRACGPVWHQRHRRAGTVPTKAIDIEAHWTKTARHGWVYGYKLHLVVTAAGVWLPLRALLTPANLADNVVARERGLLTDLPPEVRFVLGDTHYQDPALHALAAPAGWALVAPRQPRSRRRDAGTPVRRVLHEVRSRAIENFNGQFKAIFDVTRGVPTRGLAATARLALGAVFIYQLALLQRHTAGLALRVGLKPCLDAA